MIVDSSALVAMVLRETGYELLVDKISAATQAGMGAPTLVETAIVLSARLRRDARGTAARLLQELGIEIIRSSILTTVSLSTHGCVSARDVIRQR